MKQYKVLGIGEILWDLLPSGKQLGGAVTNFAYHAHTLGAEALIISRVGNDPLGREILDRLRALGLPTDGVSVDPTAPTGTVTVEVQPDGQPRFTIHENVAWDRLEAVEIGEADAICFGTLGQRCPTARRAIMAAVSAASPALCVLDINLRQHFYSREIIESSLALSDALKLNETELPVLAAMFGLCGDTRAQLAALAKQFDLRAIAFTRGANGSLLLAALHAKRNLPEVPNFGILCAGFFQALENHGTQTSKAWNDESIENERNNHETHTLSPHRSVARAAGRAPRR